MATQAPPLNGPRRNLPRLNVINPSISYSQQHAQALFSPALQTAIHTGIGNGFPLQTPMQPYFNGPVQPPPAPARHGHLARASISHFPIPSMGTPTAGHFPRPSMGLGHGPPPQPFSVGPGGLGQPLGANSGPPPMGQRPHRRQMSIGGPPKAILGGPQRKVSPNPTAAAVAATTIKKKIPVNLPNESELLEEAGTDGEPMKQLADPVSRESRALKEWARIPLPVAEGEAIMSFYAPIPSEELISREPFFTEQWRRSLPPSIDVFLPGKATWDALKQQAIETKLEKLGVERGSGSTVPHIFAPHARAASISSPADPALLFFKLNKLQQTQSAQALSPSVANSNSLAPSPQPPIGLSPPPQNRRYSPALASDAVFQNRHGHTMSLAQPPSYLRYDEAGPSLNAPTIASDLERPLSTVSDGEVPASSLQNDSGSSVTSSLHPPHLLALSRPNSRPDFIRGFGLDVPEEAEEEAELDEQERRESENRWKQHHEYPDGEDPEERQVDQDDDGHAGDTEDDIEDAAGVDGEDVDLDNDTASRGVTSASHSRIHSRHVSKLSAALSLRSVGGNLSAIVGSRMDGSGMEDNDDMDGDNSLMGRESSPPPPARRRPPLPSAFGNAISHNISANREDLEDAVAVQEWTGSEEEEDGVAESDMSDFDDDQSLGEYSNPSDEERARRQRAKKRMRIKVDKGEGVRQRALLRKRERPIEVDTEVSDREAGNEALVDQPRRIPNFPRPPESPVMLIPTQREHYQPSQPYPVVYPQPHHQHEIGQNRERDEIISNPSEENLAVASHEYRYPATVGAVMPYPQPHYNPYQQSAHFLGIAPSSSQPNFYSGVREPGGKSSPHLLPRMTSFPYPHSHSRDPSETLSYTSHGHRPNEESFGNGHQQQSTFGHIALPTPNPLYTHQHQNSFGQTPPAFRLISQPDQSQASIISARRDSLNPFAKPFVFGRPLDANAEPWQPSGGAKTPVSISLPLVGGQDEPHASGSDVPLKHSRLSSIGKALNVAAPEFKPRSPILPNDAEFTFSMPTTTPAFPVPDTVVPLSALAAVSLERDGKLYEDCSPIKKQGREKRPRLDSERNLDDASDEDVEFVDDEHSPVEEGDSMASFRFPGPAPKNESPKVIRKAYSHQPQHLQSGLGAENISSLNGSLGEAGRGEDVGRGSDFGSDMDMDDVDSDEENKENRREGTPAPVSSLTSIVMSKSMVSSITSKREHVEEDDLESIGNDTQETERSPTKVTREGTAFGSAEIDEYDYVQEIIIPPTLPVTNLSATFPTSATLRSPYGNINIPTIAGSSTKARRAPIPLDFKHPSGNTVPAGLFKALVQNVVQQNNPLVNNGSTTNGTSNLVANDDRTRRGVRSRLESRETYETHMSRPSLDDLNVTKISGTGIPSSKSLAAMNSIANRSIHLPNFTGTVANRGRNATEPIPNLSRQEDEDVFGGRHANSSSTKDAGVHRRRRSSLPDALRDPSSTSPTDNERENDNASDDDSENENQYHNSSMNANSSQTMPITHSGRRVLRSLPISRSRSPAESAKVQRLRRSETRSRSTSPRSTYLARHLDLRALENILSKVLDERLSELRREWSSVSANGKGANGASPPSDAVLSEVISLFRAQLQDSAAKSLEDTTMEARGEMDMFMIRDIMEEGHREVVGVVKTVVEEHLRQAMEVVQEARGSTMAVDETLNDLRGVVENAAGRTVRAIVDTISDLRTRQEAVAAAVNSTRRNDALLDELITTLTPVLQRLRPDPIDYDFLTNHLAQAVKPHISQLIDLASDKRETADLIVDSLIPTLVSTLVPSLVPTLAPSLLALLAPSLVDALLERLRAESDETRLGVVREVRKAVEGVDAIEIRERVADLVVERLDARFDARDKSFIGVVNSSVSAVLEEISRRMDLAEVKREDQGRKALTGEDLKDFERNVVEGVREAVANADRVPEMLGEWFDRSKEEANAAMTRAEEKDAERSVKTLLAIEGLIEKIASKEDISKSEEKVTGILNETALGTITLSKEVKALLENLLAENRSLVQENATLVAIQGAMSVQLASLPEKLNLSILNLQNGISDLVTSRDAPRKESEELKKQNLEYQIQMTKARALHGQVRVEKDLLGEKLVALESERDKLRVKVVDLEHSKNAELTVVEARKNELEEALANALGRLQASDVATQMYQQKIAELEKAVRDANADKTILKANADSFEIKATVAEREKAIATAMLEGVRREQGHWEELRQASEKIDMLTKLIGEVESDEIKDLRRYHDQTKTIEADYIALQKRYRDIENKLVNNEKVAAATKSSLLQAQQRSAEWERRAKENEGELEMTRTKLEQAEQTQSQLDSDHSLLQIQFEEREAEDRLNKDREHKQREQVAALEVKVVRLQDELVKVRPGPRNPYRNVTNGSATHPPPRPDSRASVGTVNGQKDRHLSSYSPAHTNGTTPPTASVWDSIHAPSNDETFATSASSSRFSRTSSTIHAPKSKHPNLGPTSTPKHPLARKAVYSTYSDASPYSRANAPSPAPSNVSAAPTQRDNGWWE